VWQASCIILSAPHPCRQGMIDCCIGCSPPQVPYRILSPGSRSCIRFLALVASCRVLSSKTALLGKSATAEMDQTTSREKGIVENIEIVQDRVAQLQPTHYRPQTDAETKLDKRVNRKLDLIVVTLLAVEFIVCMH
jgi:hypothetical protein